MAKHYFIAIMGLLAQLAYALPEDRDQPIEITADSAVINEKQNQAEYSGAVVVTQGTLKLEGDVVNLKTNEGGEVETFVSKGQPARFENLRQKTDKEPVRGRASTIYYSYHSDRVVLTGDAIITSNDSEFSGPEIRYDLDTGEVTASGNPSKRVNMTMQLKKK
ncbi:MAG: lipopolysaccharide transport periplasmic protein LptA [Gammaproteobacteria bacterium]|jgi:lipopolysaccharide export system protein LptA